GGEPQREPRRPCARGFPGPRRQELDEAHAGLDRPARRHHDRLPAGARLHDDQRCAVHPAEGAGVLNEPQQPSFRDDERLEEWLNSRFRKTRKSPAARPGRSRRAPPRRASSGFIAGIRTTAKTPASIPIMSTPTNAARWFWTG